MHFVSTSNGETGKNLAPAEALTPDPFESHVGRNIEWACSRRGISIEAVAKQLKKSSGFVADQIAGLRIWTARDIVRLSRVLGTSCDTLLDVRDDDEKGGVLFWR